jgi:heme A synthase
VVIHDRFGIVIIIIAVVGAVLAVISLLRPAMLPMIRAYLQLTIAAVGLQALVGIVLVITGQRPQPLHWFYGAATLLALPLAMFIGNGRGAREEPLWVAGGAVATMLFAFRAITTG